MPDPLRRLRFVILILLLLALVGILGYEYIEGMSTLDAAYMTVITLATVGYRELKELSPAGKLFTMFLIVIGVGTLAWGLQIAVDAIVGEHLSRGVWRHRMIRTIEAMKGHYIVCGHGRMGQQITARLRREGDPFVVIEDNPEQIPLLEKLGYAFIVGAAADDHVLLAAGVQRARGLVAVGPTDADNIFVTLSARGLNPDVYIVARSVKVEDEEKLRRAGADKVLSPYITGGRRMAVALLRPTVADFLDVVMHSEGLQFELEEVRVGAGSRLAGRSLTDAGVLGPSGPTVMGLKRRTGEIQAGPPGTYIIQPGDTLIVLGTEEQIEAVRGAAKG
ncbi:MAG: potassium channel protein [Armatimonadetes bacterium]|nr:potassium channel protein [Armatimonadota bacterium]